MTKIKKRKKRFLYLCFLQLSCSVQQFTQTGCEWDANKQPSAVANRPARQNRAVDRA